MESNFLHPALARIAVLSRHTIGDMELIYTIDGATNQVEFCVLPVSRIHDVVPRRTHMNDDAQVGRQHPDGRAAPWMLDSLVHLKLSEQDYSTPYGPGVSLRHNPGTAGLVYHDQQVRTEGDRREIVTTLVSTAKPETTCEHRVWWFEGESGFRVTTTFRNASEMPVTLEMLTSFSLGGITPFAPDDAPDRLWIHRRRSWWSGEGRLDSQPIEALHLERAWGTSPMRSERFGQVGSLPVRKFFPFAAIEDRAASVIWGAQIACPGSWQMEISRRGDTVELSGGLADREFGQWTKSIAPGEEFTTPEALVSVVDGDLETLCLRLTSLHRRTLATQPAVEHDLPVICNEWCTSWGHPAHDEMVALARQLRGLPVRYLVMDAGWFAPETGPWGACNGDWIPNKSMYPGGLKATADAIRAEGLIPGIWFEFETVGRDSSAFHQTDHLLHLDGRPLTVGARRFWDFRDPWVIDYLAEKVIGQLRDNGFGYLKVDYNESITATVDGADLPGEGLRSHLAGVQQFFGRLRSELPDLVIENCSSGGHRLEPSFMALCAMGSFSDAHECLEVPIIAANLHASILPAQNQIWAVLRPDDTAQRLAYSLAAGFLGRLCLSGGIADLSPEQMDIIRDALAAYGDATTFIRDGEPRRHGPHLLSQRRPRGWQAVTYTLPDGILAVIHTFEDAPDKITIPLPSDGGTITRMFPAAASEVTLSGSHLVLKNLSDFSGRVVRWSRA